VDFREFYQRHQTDIPVLDHRLKLVVAMVEELRPARLLDVGCGRATLLNELAGRLPGTGLAGVDVRDEATGPFEYRSADLTAGLPWPDNSFEVVTFGEVIEHVPDPDALLAEIHRVLVPGGQMVITTPNMVSWANRILVPFGIQPLFTETSTQHNLGRRWGVLGQGKPVQGHLKVFTHRSLREIVELNGFDVVERRGSMTRFPGPIGLIDRLCTKVVPLSSVLVYLTKAR
jgi:2-polyprenyl-3-methyl-5-hydroxy-6-metoxy-1,4-benzoquinol methylase